jgi:hypothetical protein
MINALETSRASSAVHSTSSTLALPSDTIRRPPARSAGVLLLDFQEGGVKPCYRLNSNHHNQFTGLQIGPAAT